MGLLVRLERAGKVALEEIGAVVDVAGDAVKAKGLEDAAKRG